MSWKEREIEKERTKYIQRKEKTNLWKIIGVKRRKRLTCIIYFIIRKKSWIYWNF